MSTVEQTPLEKLRAAYDEACVRVQATADVVKALPDTATAEEIRVASEANAAAVSVADQAKAERDQLQADEERQAAIQRGREAHPAPQPLDAADPATQARARGAALEEMTYRPNQRNNWEANKGYFHDLAMAKSGDPKARERLERNNLQAIEATLNDSKLSEAARQDRAGDLTTATHMGEFIEPDWTNQYYAPFARAGRPFADQCINIGTPVSTSWNLPRVTTGSLAAVQTEGSALANQDQASDSIQAILQTIGGYSLASYQLVELAEPGMDQILFADLAGALNLAIDQSLLQQATSNAQGFFSLTGINSVTWAQTTPSVVGLWPTIFQAKSKIETNVPGSVVSFILMHSIIWNWLLSQLDSQTRPLFTTVEGAGFNNLGSFNGGATQGLAGNIDGIPVILDQSITLVDGAGTNQSKIGLCDRSALLTKESAPRTFANPVTNSTSLMWTFQSYSYLQRMFGRYPKKISAITGSGLVTPAGFTG